MSPPASIVRLRATRDALQQRPGFLGRGCLRQHQLLHAYVRSGGQYADSVPSSGMGYGFPVEREHAGPQAQLRHEVFVVLALDARPPGAAVDLLKSDQIGPLRADRFGELLQRSFLAEAKIVSHDLQAQRVPAVKRRHGTCRRQYDAKQNLSKVFHRPDVESAETVRKDSLIRRKIGPVSR